MDNFLRTVLALIGWGMAWMGIAMAGVMYDVIDVSQNLIIPVIVIGFSLYTLAAAATTFNKSKR